mmetsp:Transcript_64438/g.119861  ORF Transcript_64438/g.119861 Transcript_64438/m.119861 type:complete len:280 (+) Transcript_64438:3-842(+)
MIQLGFARNGIISRLLMLGVFGRGRSPANQQICGPEVLSLLFDYVETRLLDQAYNVSIWKAAVLLRVHTGSAIQHSLYVLPGGRTMFKQKHLAIFLDHPPHLLQRLYRMLKRANAKSVNDCVEALILELHVQRSSMHQPHGNWIDLTALSINNLQHTSGKIYSGQAGHPTTAVVRQVPPTTYCNLQHVSSSLLNQTPPQSSYACGELVPSHIFVPLFRLFVKGVMPLSLRGSQLSSLFLFSARLFNPCIQQAAAKSCNATEQENCLRVLDHLGKPQATL